MLRPRGLDRVEVSNRLLWSEKAVVFEIRSEINVCASNVASWRLEVIVPMV